MGKIHKEDISVQLAQLILEECWNYDMRPSEVIEEVMKDMLLFDNSSKEKISRDLHERKKAKQTRTSSSRHGDNRTTLRNNRSDIRSRSDGDIRDEFTNRDTFWRNGRICERLIEHNSRKRRPTIELVTYNSCRHLGGSRDWNTSSSLRNEKLNTFQSKEIIELGRNDDGKTKTKIIGF